MALPPKWYQFLVSVFASLGSILYGYDLGVIAEAVASDNFKNLFKPTASETGAVVSVFTGGAFVGAGIAGPVGDMLGRRLTIMIGALIFLVGGALQTGAQNLSYLYAGRCKDHDRRSPSNPRSFHTDAIQVSQDSALASS